MFGLIWLNLFPVRIEMRGHGSNSREKEHFLAVLTWSQAWEAYANSYPSRLDGKQCDVVFKQYKKQKTKVIFSSNSVA